MDTKQRKRRQRVHLTLIYSMMVLTVLFTVVIFAYAIQGYRLNWSSGKVVQGGLVQFDTHPDGAQVTVDQTRLSNETPSKLTLSAGQRNVTIQREGYRDWHKTVDVKPGSVLWLDYARLISSNPSHKNVATASGASSAIASGNNRYLAFTPSAHKPTVTLADLSGDKPQTTNITLDSAHYTAPDNAEHQAFTLDSWDKDNRYVTIKHTYNGDKTEWLVLHPQGGHKPEKGTRQPGVNVTAAKFSQGDSRKLFVLTGEGDLRQANLSDTTITGPLVSNVAEFALYSDTTITYTTKLDHTSKQRTAGYLTIGTTKPRTVRSYADDGVAPLHFRIEKYYDKVYYVIAYGETAEILSSTSHAASDSRTASSLKSVASLSMPGGISHVDFSRGGHRFACVYNDASLMTYDLELLKSSTIKLPQPLTRDINWIDGYHFTFTHGGVHLYDFDGANQQRITTSALDLPVVLSQNQRYLYSFVKTKDGVALRQTKIVNDN